jgi:hypothetical protein
MSRFGPVETEADQGHGAHQAFQAPFGYQQSIRDQVHPETECPCLDRDCIEATVHERLASREADHLIPFSPKTPEAIQQDLGIDLTACFRRNLSTRLRQPVFKFSECLLLS